MSSEQSTPPATEEIRLLLIGPPKTGQSSIANILAGAHVFPVGGSSSVHSPTPTTQTRQYTNKKLLVGKHLLIVDAPVRFALALRSDRSVLFLASVRLKRFDHQ